MDHHRPGGSRPLVTTPTTQYAPRPSHDPHHVGTDPFNLGDVPVGESSKPPASTGGVAQILYQGQLRW
jgi:hypothetical protein